MSNSIHHNFQLQPYNSFRTRAEAKIFATANTIDELKNILKKYPNEEKLVLGNGCNLFFTKNFDGLVIKPQMEGISIIGNTDEYVDIEVGAAQDWDQFVEFCVERGWSGIENLSLIPGSVGAAPIQNIGAYGVEVKDVITEVNTIEIATGAVKTFKNSECNFEYRDSLFKKTRQYIITSVVFRLSKSFVYHKKYKDLKHELSATPLPTLRQVRDAIIRIRKRKLPSHIELPNAGSFFKNPVLSKTEKDNLLTKLPNAPIYPVANDSFKTSAAFLIEQAGYKGKRIGNVGTYINHALIIVNYGTNNGQEIENFKHEIQKSVNDKYDILLESEVWIF